MRAIPGKLDECWASPGLRSNSGLHAAARFAASQTRKGQRHDTSPNAKNISGTSTPYLLPSAVFRIGCNIPSSLDLSPQKPCNLGATQQLKRFPVGELPPGRNELAYREVESPEFVSGSDALLLSMPEVRNEEPSPPLVIVRRVGLNWWDFAHQFAENRAQRAPTEP